MPMQAGTASQSTPAPKGTRRFQRGKAAQIQTAASKNVQEQLEQNLPEEHDNAASWMASVRRGKGAASPPRGSHRTTVKDFELFCQYLTTHLAHLVCNAPNLPRCVMDLALHSQTIGRCTCQLEQRDGRTFTDAHTSLEAVRRFVFSQTVARKRPGPGLKTLWLCSLCGSRQSAAALACDMCGSKRPPDELKPRGKRPKSKQQGKPADKQYKEGTGAGGWLSWAKDKMAGGPDQEEAAGSRAGALKTPSKDVAGRFGWFDGKKDAGPTGKDPHAEPLVAPKASKTTPVKVKARAPATVQKSPTGRGNTLMAGQAPKIQHARTASSTSSGDRDPPGKEPTAAVPFSPKEKAMAFIAQAELEAQRELQAELAADAAEQAQADQEGPATATKPHSSNGTQQPDPHASTSQPGAEPYPSAAVSVTSAPDAAKPLHAPAPAQASARPDKASAPDPAPSSAGPPSSSAISFSHPAVPAPESKLVRLEDYMDKALSNIGRVSEVTELVHSTLLLGKQLDAFLPELGMASRLVQARAQAQASAALATNPAPGRPAGPTARFSSDPAPGAGEAVTLMTLTLGATGVTEWNKFSAVSD
eukprot:gene1867-464_t